jgi:type 1 glutamine amidotransferase
VRVISWLLALAVGGVTAVAASADAAPGAGYRILIFSKTVGYRHPSIPGGVAAIRQLGVDNGFVVDSTEDPRVFTAANLRRYRAVVWLSTTGTVLDDTQRAAFRGYIEGGGGYVGVHAAADTEHDWPWYGGLVGAYFSSHPAIQPATVRFVDRTDPSTAHSPATWRHVDEWYNFASNPRSAVTVLAVVDESSYSGGTMGADHPVTWCHSYDGGRAWYTGMGHTSQSFTDTIYRRVLLGGIEAAAGVVRGACGWP